MFCGLALFGAAISGTLATASVIGWRTDGTGSYPDADPPIRWAHDSDNVVWCTEMPGWGNSTPVGEIVRIADGRVLAASIGVKYLRHSSPVLHDRTVYFACGENECGAVRLPEKAGDLLTLKPL